MKIQREAWRPLRRRPFRHVFHAARCFSLSAPAAMPLTPAIRRRQPDTPPPRRCCQMMPQREAGDAELFASRSCRFFAVRYARGCAERSIAARRAARQAQAKAERRACMMRAAECVAQCAMMVYRKIRVRATPRSMRLHAAFIAADTPSARLRLAMLDDVAAQTRVHYYDAAMSDVKIHALYPTPLMSIEKPRVYF